jgi:UDP-N-acetylglucosamine 2-epimerase (non-hydrolysing)
MQKIMTIVGTRPEIIKMSAIIPKLDRLSQHVLVHTGQNYDYELNQVFFDDLDIRKPDYFLGAAGRNAAETIARVIVTSDEIFEREKPDAVLIYGDTNSGLAVISAKRRKIPVFHMEAGNRCFDQRVPEELNRKVIDHLSDINMVLTEAARRYLLAEGLPGDRIFKVGSHLPEVLNLARAKVDASRALEQLGLEKERYFVVSAHREENVDFEGRLTALIDALNGLSEEYGFPIIVSTHPRTQARMTDGQRSSLSRLVMLMKPFSYTDYIKLQQNAFCVISDSGTITEEASLLDLPAITVRDIHERPEGMDAGTLVMSSMERTQLSQAVRVVRDGFGKNRRFAGAVRDYEAVEVSTKVVRIVFSYIEFVNRVVWSKAAYGSPSPLNVRS